MKTVLVSGASGIIGYGILRSIRRSDPGIRLIGTSIYHDSPAQGFCDVFEIAPPSTDAGYTPWLKETIRKHQVDLIIPGIEIDMYQWSAHTSEIEQSGVKVLLNKPDLIDLCRDKWIFYEHLCRFAPVHAIQTSLSNDFAELSATQKLPFLLKPRSGHGSKGIVRVDSQEAFSRHAHMVGPTLMAQTLVGNDDSEYSSAVYGDGRGGFYATMTLRRKLSESGFTDKAEVVKSAKIEEALRVLTKIFKPVGPANFQFREHEGVMKLLEINPRISSSTSIRAAFGYNEAAMAIRFLLDDQLPEQPVIREGRAVRYIEDLIFYK